MDSIFWSCNQCTLENGEALERCQLCDAERPKQFNPKPVKREPEEIWPCPQCTAENLKTQKECLVCGFREHEEYVEIKEPVEQVNYNNPAIWKCPECTFENPVIKASCQICETPRPDDSLPAGVLLPHMIDGHAIPDEIFHAFEPHMKKMWRRNQEVVGTRDKRSFQTSIKSPKDDPLMIQQYDGLGWHCHTQLGVYSDPYNFFLPIMTVELPTDMLKDLPPDVGNALHRVGLGHPNPDPADGGGPAGAPAQAHEFNFFMLLYDKIGEEENEAYAEMEYDTVINVVTHLWLFRELPFAEYIRIEKHVSVGLFDPYNVEEMFDQNHQPDENPGGAIPFGRLEKRSVFLHHCAFSPNNCQLKLKQGSDFHSFFVLASDENRTVLTFHLIPGTKHLASLLKKASRKCEYLEGIMLAIHRTPGQVLLANKLEQLLRSFLR